MKNVTFVICHIFIVYGFFSLPGSEESPGECGWHEPCGELQDPQQGDSSPTCTVSAFSFHICEWILLGYSADFLMHLITHIWRFQMPAEKCLYWLDESIILIYYSLGLDYMITRKRKYAEHNLSFILLGINQVKYKCLNKCILCWALWNNISAIFPCNIWLSLSAAVPLSCIMTFIQWDRCVGHGPVHWF